MIKTSLNKKILALVHGLIVAVIITIGVAVLVSTNQTVYQQANQQLVIGQKVFEKLLDEHGNQLLGSASVLVDDFGFKQAVSSKDAPTIESALENAGLRINADLMLLTDLNGELIAQVSKSERLNRNAVASRVNDSTPQGSYSNIAFVGGRIYQIVLLPVKAPLPIAWVLVGLEIDDAFAAQINSLTNLEVAFQGDGDSGSKRHIVSTLIDDIASSEQMDNMNAFISETTNGFRYMTLNTSLYEGKSGYVRANLHASLDDAYAVFEQLQWQILSISALALLISLIGAMITSRNVTRPVADLVEAAERISGGDYNKKISYTGKPSTEIIALGHSFELMQTQIAEREELLSSQASHRYLMRRDQELFDNSERHSQCREAQSSLQQPAKEIQSRCQQRHLRFDATNAGTCHIFRRLTSRQLIAGCNRMNRYLSIAKSVTPDAPSLVTDKYQTSAN